MASNGQNFLPNTGPDMASELEFAIELDFDALVPERPEYLLGDPPESFSVSFFASRAAWRAAGAEWIGGAVECNAHLTRAISQYALDRCQGAGHWATEIVRSETESFLREYRRELLTEEAKVRARSAGRAADDSLPQASAPVAKPAVDVDAPLDDDAPAAPAKPAVDVDAPLDDDARRHPRTLRLGSMPGGRAPFPLPAKRATREPQPPQRPRTITASEMLVDIDPDATARGSSTRVRLAQLAVCALVTIGGLYASRSGPTPAPSRAAMPLSAPAATPAPSSAAMPLTPPAAEQQPPQEPEEPVELDTAEDTAPEATRQSTPSESTMRRKRRARVRARNARRKAQRAAAAAAAAAENSAEAPRQQDPAKDNESTIGRALHSVRLRQSALIRAVRQAPEKEIAPRTP